MPVQTADAGSVTFTGSDAETVNSVEVLPGRIQFSGEAALNIGAAPSVSSVPDALRLEIVTADGTPLVNDLVTRRNLSFTVEHNGSGSIDFETDLDAFPDGMDDVALDPSNLVRVHYGDLPDWPNGVAEGLIATAPPTKDILGRWTMQMQCPGSWDALDWGVLFPPDGPTGDTRDFNYNAGLTRDVAIWATPVGVKVKKSFRWLRSRRPRNWPDSVSQWVWSSSPEKVSPLGLCRFVGSFITTVEHDYRFYVAGDDTLSLYLNGALLKHKAAKGWYTTSTFVRHLKPGTHVLTGVVKNLAGTNRKAGFACAVGRLNNDGEVVEWKIRSSPTTFKYRSEASVALPPDGWFPAAVLWQAVNEAADRGVEFHPQITLTFDDTHDSDGSAWTVKGPVEYEIGISNAALGEKVRSLGTDAAMLPGLELSTWRSRGFDLSDRVVISKANKVGWSARAWSRVRTLALTHHESGWTSSATTDADLIDRFGRRELTLSGGGTDGDLQAAALASSAMDTSASPEETIEAEITSADLRAGAPQPLRDFGPADTVLMETVGGFQRVKVMAITGAEQNDKSVNWTIAGYPV